jgi:hypothetical protein
LSVISKNNLFRSKKSEGYSHRRFSPRSGSRIAVIVSTKYILCVLDTYENLLPCPQIENTKQYYVIFDDPIASYSVITTLELSPGLKEWIGEQIVGRVWTGYGNEYDIPD